MAPPQTSFSSYYSSSFSYAWRFDVFINFRGKDTRHGFTGSLYKALDDQGIEAFIDHEELQKGNEITSSLIKAIQESRIFIIVLSSDYASSSFCLDELLQIIECLDQKDRLVLPVFYNLDPCDVRHQINSFEKPMAKHEKRFKNDNGKVQKWRMALKRVADLSGYHLKQGDGQYEHKVIEEIVEDISRKMEREPLPVADYPVGLDSDMSNIISLLDIESKDSVHIVGIHGIGGIGKTTLALAIYNSIADHFQIFCFLEDVKGISKSHGLGYLQELLLSELLGKDKFKSIGVRDATTKIHRALGKKKVLLVLDNVDSEKQLRAIVGKLNWFCPGSRIIITTRDKQLLKSNGVEKTYEVEGLNDADALELLSWKAFKTSEVDTSYTDVLNRVVTYACGLPLVLEVIGPILFGKSVDEWDSAIKQYERIPHGEIHEILEKSYDALQDEEQRVFLDIACCFKGYELAEVEDILRAHHGSCMKSHIRVLVDKSLIKISKYGKVTLHDMIVNMGKEIVRRESPEAPEKRSRLWDYKDIVRILKHNQGTGAIQMIHLKLPSCEVEESEDPLEEKNTAATIKWDGKGFKRMTKLKTLIVKNVHFSRSPTYLPNNLRVLEWWRYPSNYFSPSGLNELSILKLPDNILLPQLNSFSVMANLTVLNFDYQRSLEQIPDVSGSPNLEILSFRGCANLVNVHPSVGFLKKLKILNASSCHKLMHFPPISLPSLQVLDLSECSLLENFPQIQGKMENLKSLSFEGTKISFAIFFSKPF